jgi:hypothetical protein
MRPSNSPPLPAQHRFRADLTAFVAGGLALPLAWLLAESPLRSWAPSLLILILVTALAVAASLAITLADKQLTSGITHSMRTAARATILTALLAAAMVVLVSRLSISQTAAVLSFIPAVLSILPASFFGMLAGACAAGLQLPSLPKPSVEGTELQGKALLLLLVLACVVGFFAPLFPARIQGTRSMPARVASVPPVPPWRYSKPADFAKAEASRWEVLTTRQLGHVQSSTQVVISPVRELFACVDGNQLRIVDLNMPTNAVSFQIIGGIQSMSFSPDEGRLFFQTEQNLKRVGVIDLTTSRVTDLPTPKAYAVPSGDVVWWTTDEVAFQNSKGPLRILNLETLEIESEESSTAWTALPPSDRLQWSSPRKVNLPASERCSLEFRPAITTTEMPTDLKQREWRMSGNTLLAVKDDEHDYRRFLQLDVLPDDRYLGPKDGSKLVRIRNNDAVVFYFGLRPRSPVSFKLAMPKPRESYSDKELSAALSHGDLCAFVYSPMVNPLNQRVVGPDRERVKGLVRFATWNGRDASLWLAEEFFSVEPGDIIADIHVWKNNSPQLIPDSDPHRWWSRIGPITDRERDLASTPTQASTQALQHDSRYEQSTQRGSLVLQKIDFQPVLQPTPAPPSQNPFNASNLTNPPPIPPKDFRALDANNPVVRQLGEFITAHHAKANSGDVNGLVADYADQVRYSTNGLVDRAFIFRDETISRARFRRISERITSTISIEQLSFDQFRAQYWIEFDGVKKNNQRVRGSTNVFLVIWFSPQGPRIISQQSAVESGE